MSKYVREVNECLLELKKGNISEFDKLYDMTVNHLRCVAWLYLYNKSDCDDVLSDLYCRVFKYVYNFDETMDGYNWLCRIAQNLAYNYNKRGSVREDDVKEKCEDCDYIERWNFIDAAIDVKLGIAGLSDVEQRIIMLKCQMGYSVREIAKIIGCSKSEVQRKYKIILKKLDHVKTIK